MMASARRRSRPGWRSRFRKRGSTSISPRCVFGGTLISHTSATGPKIFQLFAPVTKKTLMDTGGGFGGSPKHDLRSQRSPLRDRFSSGKSARRSAFDNNYVTMRSVFLVSAIAFVVAGSVAAKENAETGGAEENVRAVQSKLADEGCYFGEIDGAYSSDFSTALSRYQIRNGLPITGQLDAETSKALNAKPAIGPSIATTEQSSETWRQLRKRERRKSTKARQSEPVPTETSSPEDNETPTGTDTPIQTTPVEARSSAESTQPASAPPAEASTGEFSTERLRDYVAAFVLAGLDKSVGAEAEYFADRVEYYDQGVMDREKIRQDLKRYDQRWPERHFWLAGKINVEPQSENRVRVTFPLGFKLRNGNKQSSGKVDKTLVLEPAGDDLQIVAVNERKAG